MLSRCHISVDHAHVLIFQRRRETSASAVFKCIWINVDMPSYSEVVEGGVWQAASGDVFGQLIQHLRVLRLRRKHTIIRHKKRQTRHSTARSRRRNWHAWPGCCGEWVLCAAGCWNATSLFSSCHQTWTPGTDGPPHTPEENSRVTHTHTQQKHHMKHHVQQHTCVNMGLPFCVTIVHWSQSRDTKLLWKDSLGCFRT